MAESIRSDENNDRLVASQLPEGPSFSCSGSNVPSSSSPAKSHIGERELNNEEENCIVPSTLVAARRHRKRTSREDGGEEEYACGRSPQSSPGSCSMHDTLVIRKKWKRGLLMRSLPSPNTNPTTMGSSETMTMEQHGAASPAPPLHPVMHRSMSTPSVLSTNSSTSSHPVSADAGGSASSSSAVHQLVLPTIRSSKHPDLNVISPETVAKLLNGDFKGNLSAFELIDCRFSYEHDGGSLKGAKSLNDPATVEQKYLTHPLVDSKRTALIFFCEFSANRAPKMMRHVRNLDRWIHAERYPELFYPELYLVDGGYKNCFQTLKDEICYPPTYVPMKEKEFADTCKLEFTMWRKRWKAHKTAVCAAKFQQHHHKYHHFNSRGNLSSQGDYNGDDDDQPSTQNDSVDFAPMRPPLALRSFSQLL